MKQIPLSVGIALAFMAACHVSVASSEEREVRIGASLALSGKLAATGDHEQKAITLALEEINRGPVKIKVVYDDNAGEAAKAVSGVTKLLSIDKVDVVFAAFSHIVLAIRDIVRRSERIFLYSGGTDKPLQDSSRVFKDWSEADEQGVVMAQAMRLGNFRAVAILAEANEVCEDVMTTFTAQSAVLDFSVVAHEHYNPGETDFRSLLLRLAAKKPHVIVMCDFRDAGVIMRQYNEINLMNIPTVHAFAPFIPESDTPEIRAIYEKNKARSAWINFVEGSLSEKQKAFSDLFRARYGKEPRMEAVFAYDDMFLLAKAAHNCFKPALDHGCMSKNMQLVDHEGVGGRLAFGERRSSHRETKLIEVKGGRWVDVPLR